MGLFSSNRRTKEVAAIIHQLCQAARHANSVMGSTGAVNFFAQHPFMVSHRQPTDAFDGHEFWLSRELKPFRFLVYEDKDQIQVLGGDDYSGITLTTTQSGGSLHEAGHGYTVMVTPPISRQMGRKTRALESVFVSDYGALDTSAAAMRARYFAAL